MRTLITLFLVAAVALVFAAAQDVATQGGEEEEVFIRSSPDILTEYVFPNNPDLKFYPGEIVDVVFSMINTGQHPITVDGISATLYYHLDARYAIQNYTLTRSSLVLQPRDDRSLAYRFMPHPMLEVGEFGLYGQVYYHDWENMNYTTVFFNQTIDLVDPPSALDSDTLLRVFGGIAIALLVGFLGWRFTSRQRKTEYGTRGGAMSSEWLAGTAATAKPGKKKSR